MRRRRDLRAARVGRRPGGARRDLAEALGSAAATTTTTNNNNDDDKSNESNNT